MILDPHKLEGDLTNWEDRMAVKKGLEELSEYKLTRKEVADFLGITPNAVKCSLRSGNKRGLEFRFNGYQNLFKVPKSLKNIF